VARAWTAALVAAASLAAPASAKDAATFPEGVSTQTFGDHSFELAVPKAGEAKPPYSLLLLVSGKLGAQDFAPFTKDGYVVVAPRQKLAGGMWATSEAKDILDFVERVEGALPVAKDLAHVLTIEDTFGFASFVAFDKRAAFVSFSLVASVWKGQSPPADAKKRVGVLSMGKAEARRGDSGAIVEALTGKVRTVEYREDGGPFDRYFRYWLGVMEGRFQPGYDLSFDWIADADAPAAAPKQGTPPPAAQTAFDKAKECAKTTHGPSLVYFWSADDAAKPEAKALQNEVFFDPELRAAVRRGLAVKLERAKYEAAFAAFGLKTTPAVVVVDASFAELDEFEGAIQAKQLVKSVTKAQSAKPR
jgi:hypothetical protein